MTPLERKLWQDIAAMKTRLRQMGKDFAWVEDAYPEDPYNQAFILQGLLKDD